MSSRASRTIYVGNLPGDVREREIEDLFYKYGRIIDIDLKLPPRPPGYCFIEFEDARDAEDAIRGRDGYNFDGNRLRVELAHGGRGPPSSVDRYNSFTGAGGGASRGVDGGRTGGVSRRSEYRVRKSRFMCKLPKSGRALIVTGLPSSASWQDLKDHMRRAGDVCFAQVFRDGNGTMGIVDFTNYDDMKYACGVREHPVYPAMKSTATEDRSVGCTKPASELVQIRKLDDSEFRNPFSRSFIRVKEDKGYGFRRTSSRSASRSRSRSPGRIRSASKSPQSRSASRSLSHSRSRSRSQRRSLSTSKERSRSPSLIHSGSRSPQRTRSSSNPPRSRSTSPKAKEKVNNPNFSASPVSHE